MTLKYKDHSDLKEFEKTYLRNKDIKFKDIEEYFVNNMNEGEKKIYKFNKTIKELSILTIISIANLLFLRKISKNKRININISKSDKQHTNDISNVFPASGSNSSFDVIKQFFMFNLIGFYFGFSFYYYSIKSIDKLFYKVSKKDDKKLLMKIVYRKKLKKNYKHSYNTINIFIDYYCIQIQNKREINQL